MNLKDTPYWQIFNDVWDLFKNNMPVQDTDKYWEKIVNEADALYKKYKSQPESKFARSLITGIISELERVSKSGKEGLNEPET